MKNIVGNWQIVSIKDEATYFNFETDSFSFARISAEQPSEPAMPDSTIQQTKSFLKAFMGQFKMVFKSDHKFTIQMADKLKETGSFSLDEKTKRIRMTGGGKSKSVEEKIYAVNADRLQLKDVEGEGKDVEMIFKRIN